MGAPVAGEPMGPEAGKQQGKGTGKDRDQAKPPFGEAEVAHPSDQENE